MANPANFNLKTIFHAPHAKDDQATALENMVASFLLSDLMANDLGGNGKSFYGIDQADPRIASTTATTALGATISVVNGAIRYDSAGSGALQALGSGQTAVDTFSYTIRLGNGMLSVATVSVTVTGTNDAPVIVAATATGALTEIADGAAGENATSLVAGGAISFADLDTDDLHSATATAQGANYLGALTLGAVDQGADSVAWSFAVDDAALDFLGAGETRVQYYDVAISDGQGGTAIQTVAITLTGTNDAPTVTSAVAAGTVVEDVAASAAGTIAFADVDLVDAHSISVSPNGAGYTGLFSAAIGDASTGDGAGSTGWTYAIDNDFAQHLGAGQTVTQSYTVTVADAHGGSADQIVTVTITGTNDAPVIGGGDTGGAVLEAEPVTGIPAASTPILLESASNDIFATAQTIDRASLRIADNVNLGDDSDPAITINGSINSTADQDVYAITLDPGETITLDIDFGLGFGTVAFPGYGTIRGLDAYVSIFDAAGNLINVNDDAPTGLGGAGSIYTQDSYLQFTAAAAGTYYVVVHDWQEGGARSEGPYSLQLSIDSQALQLTDSGTLSFTDIDLIDAHSVAVTPQGAGYLGALTATVSDAATGDGAGTIRWDFAVANSAVQYLGVGQELVQSYAVEVSDGQGGVSQEIVTVTVTGTNDVPVIGNALSRGDIVEDSVLAVGGQIGFADADLVDAHSVSFAADQPGYVGSFAAVLGDAATGDGAGVVDWSFSVDNSAIEQLAEGQWMLQRYTITISDGNGGTTQQLVNVTITGTNDGPVAVADTAATGENQPLTLNVLANDSDVDNGAVLTLVSASGPDGKGDVSVAGNQLAFDPGSDFDHLAVGESEIVTLDYIVADQFGVQSTASVTLTVNGANDAPVANDDVLVRQQTVQLISNGGFENGLTGWTQTNLGSGGWSVESDTTPPNNTFITPGPQSGASYVVSFQSGPGVHAIEQSFTVPTGTVSLILNYASFVQTGAALVINPAGLTHTAGANQHARVDLLDAGSGALSTSAADIVTNFYIGRDGAPTQPWRTYSFDITAQATPGQSFDLRFAQADNGGNFNLGVDSVGLTAVVGSDPTEDAVLTIASAELLANDVDVDGDTLTIVGVAGTSALGASVVLGGDGNIAYDARSALNHLAEGEEVEDSFTYTIDDGNGGTDTATVRFTVVGVNDAPVAVGDLADAETGINAPFAYALPAGAFTDADGDTLTLSAELASGAPLPSWLTFNAATGSFSGTPTGANAGDIDIVVTASDGIAAATYSFTLTVDPDQRLVGTNNADTIGGDVGDDVIIGANGDDILTGGAGDDIIWGDSENGLGADPTVPSPLTATAQSYYTRGNSLVNGLGGGAGFGENILGRNDDGSTGVINIQSIFGTGGIDFFGRDFTQLWVNNNGNLTFNGALFQYVPSPISPTIAPIIAAFWTDVDTRAGVISTSPGGTSTGSNLVYWDLDTANGVFTATWDDVGEYSFGTTPNSFQIQLVNRGSGDFDILLRYETIQWDHGGARAGYSSGNGVAYELGGSGTGAVYNYDTTAGNTGVTGLHVYQVRNGQVLTDTDDVINGGDGADTMAGGVGLDTFLFVAGEADGDIILDFNGNGTGLGDSLSFSGYGAGATLTQVNATAWEVSSADGSIQEIITLANGATINPADYVFV